MLVYWILVYTLFTNTAQAFNLAPICEPGFTPFVCRYKCNCRDTFTCAGLGYCYGPCKRTYFGYGCQFVDVLSFEQNDDVPYYLRDSNDDTCNRYPSTFIDVALLKPHTLSWFRIVVNKPEFLFNFTTTLNNGEECVMERKFRVDTRTVDVTCEMSISITKMKISGRIASSICTIYISLGRNLAIHENASQSSTYQGNRNYYGPQKAVDSNTNRSVGLYSCSQTDSNPSGSWWSVNFTYAVTLYRVRVWNRNDDKAHRLNGFNLKTYSRNNQMVGSYVGGTNIAIQDFQITSTIPVTSMVIQQSRNFASRDLALTLCEVEAFGDYKCPRYMYGISCERHCNCTSLEDCHHATGGCALGCPLGFHGRTCTSVCSSTCKNKYCDFIEGHCYGCIPGYIGPLCNTVCPRGRWGIQCISYCPVLCPLNCSQITGDCICEPGFSGQRCEECTRGRYGMGCLSVCSEGCDNTCHHITGNCLCKIGYMGMRCEACPAGSYGLRCTLNCFKGCINRCNHVTGDCLCKPGYTGSRCEGCPPGLYGPQCLLNCSEGCNNTCNYISGHCLCKPGYTFSNCQECPAGSYGLGCASSCNLGCNNTCNHLTGNCLCKIGYVEPRCEECPSGFYGMQCVPVCSHGCTYTCNHITGDCLCKTGFAGSRCTDCTSGLFGPYCNLTCPFGCENNICDAVSLKCLKCKHGFIGHQCDECEYGFYGTLCNLKCPSLCVNNICDKKTGVCKQCKFGLSVEMCKDCPEYLYGILCTKKCSANCASTTCDRENGNCSKCLHQFIGDKCDECPEKTYGDGCSLKCSSNCLYKTCEKESGRCSQCQAGYSGDNCEETDGMSPYWLLFVILIVLAGFALMYIRRPKPKTSVDELSNHT